MNNNDALYLATNKDIYKTSDDGASWVNVTQGFVTNSGNSNRFIEFSGDNIFISSTILGVFASSDYGSTWQMDTTGLDPEYYTQVDLLYSDGKYIFASRGYSTYGLYKKAALLGAWTRVNSNSIGTSFATQVHGMTRLGNSLFASTYSAGVYESIDNGITWTQKANADYPTVEMFSISSNRLVSVGNNLCVATANGVFKSADLGDNWVRVDQGFSKWDQLQSTPIMCLYSDGSNLYASMVIDNSAYVSTDMGNKWSDISDGLQNIEFNTASYFISH